MDLVKRFLLLFLGLFLYSIGILLTIHANLGASPWDVFHLGLSSMTGLTIGKVSQIVGVVLIVVNYFLKERIGWGTIFNMYFIGLFIDIIQDHGLIVSANSLPAKIIMLLLGIITMGWATFFYMNSALGIGPRDGLMIGLSKRFSARVWKVRTVIEVCVVAIGFLFGGPVGIGTVVSAFLIGPSIQLAYTVVGKDPKGIVHRTITDDIKAIFSPRGKLKKIIKK
ncbi:MAG TPA: membrane protein [Clostridiales bacterium]|nr:membrane protein [Clostridiales bacterium]